MPAKSGPRQGKETLHAGAWLSMPVAWWFDFRVFTHRRPLQPNDSNFAPPAINNRRLTGTCAALKLFGTSTHSTFRIHNMINTLPLLIKEHDLTIETPNMPFTLSGGCADLFVGHHRVSGKVAVKRLRLSEQMDNEDAVVKVSPPIRRMSSQSSNFFHPPALHSRRDDLAWSQLHLHTTVPRCLLHG